MRIIHRRKLKLGLLPFSKQIGDIVEKAGVLDQNRAGQMGAEHISQAKALPRVAGLVAGAHGNGKQRGFDPFD